MYDEVIIRKMSIGRDDFFFSVDECREEELTEAFWEGQNILGIHLANKPFCNYNLLGDSSAAFSKQDVFNLYFQIKNTNEYKSGSISQYPFMSDLYHTLSDYIRYKRNHPEISTYLLFNIFLTCLQVGSNRDLGIKPVCFYYPDVPTIGQFFRISDEYKYSEATAIRLEPMDFDGDVAELAPVGGATLPLDLGEEAPQPPVEWHELNIPPPPAPPRFVEMQVQFPVEFEGAHPHLTEELLEYEREEANPYLAVDEEYRDDGVGAGTVGVIRGEELTEREAPFVAVQGIDEETLITGLRTAEQQQHLQHLTREVVQQDTPFFRRAMRDLIHRQQETLAHGLNDGRVEATIRPAVRLSNTGFSFRQLNEFRRLAGTLREIPEGDNGE